MRAELGTLPDGFTRYILDRARFPRLLIHCYDIAMQHNLIDTSGKLLVKNKIFKPHVIGSNIVAKQDSKGSASSNVKIVAGNRSRWLSSADQWVQSPVRGKSKPRGKGKRKGRGRQKIVKDKRTKTRLCQKWEESDGMVC